MALEIAQGANFLRSKLDAVGWIGPPIVTGIQFFVRKKVLEKNRRSGPEVWIAGLTVRLHSCNRVAAFA